MKYLGMIFLVLILAGCAVKMPEVEPAMPPVSHQIWDAMLHQYVGENGFVNYKAWLEDTTRLQDYLSTLAASHPQKTWSKVEQKAYWINAYNAYTVKLVLDHFPVSSIKDIKSGIPFVNTVWDIKFINIQGQVYDLNNIEHGILRAYFKDGRLHAALNCASFSCPRLRNEAYVAERLDEQLDDAMRTFINDPLRNRISSNSAELSSIFKWFSGDFKADAGSVRKFVNRYSATPIQSNTDITYIEYDWSLNETGNTR